MRRGLTRKIRCSLALAADEHICLVCLRDLRDTFRKQVPASAGRSLWHSHFEPESMQKDTLHAYKLGDDKRG